MTSIKSLLVIGDNHREIVNKYSLYDINEKNIELNVVLQRKKEDIERLLEIYNSLDEVMKDNIDLDKIKSGYSSLIDKYKEMDGFEYYEMLLNTGKITQTEDLKVNPNSKYQMPRCYDEEIQMNQDFEAPMVDPFILKDGSKAYSAKVKDIDWEIVHLGKSDLYRTIWELCVNRREPVNDDEKNVIGMLGCNTAYWSKFKDVDEYIQHACAFWTFGIATESSYIACDENDGNNWINEYYSKYIETLNPDETITLYQIETLN